MSEDEYAIFVRFIDQGGGRLACAAAICPAECQKLVSCELHVSQASAAGISRRLGRDESSERLAHELKHSWRCLGDKMRLESGRAQTVPARCRVLTTK